MPLSLLALATEYSGCPTLGFCGWGFSVRPLCLPQACFFRASDLQVRHKTRPNKKNCPPDRSRPFFPPHVSPCAACVVPARLWSACPPVEGRDRGNTAAPRNPMGLNLHCLIQRTRRNLYVLRSSGPPARRLFGGSPGLPAISWARKIASPSSQNSIFAFYSPRASFVATTSVRRLRQYMTSDSRGPSNSI
jgi:hypothetical protein